MLLALDLGADDFDGSESEFYISVAPQDMETVRDGLEKAGRKIISAEASRVASSTVDVDEATEAKIRRMLDMFDEDDDVQNVYHNANLSDEDDE